MAPRNAALKKKNPAAVALGSLGGQKRTKAKAQASRLNGLKGGRPRSANFKPRKRPKKAATS
jgi:hypothetical protein